MQNLMKGQLHVGVVETGFVNDHITGSNYSRTKTNADSVEGANS